MGATSPSLRAQWKALFPEDLWVQEVVFSGLRLTQSPLPFHIAPPRPRREGISAVQGGSDLLSKRATERVCNTDTPGFYSRRFVVPKPGDSWRPAIALSALNRHINAPSFKMETARGLRAAVQPNADAVSLGMKDAYLHVSGHNVRGYLRFVVEGKV